MTVAITAKSGMSGYQYRYATTKSGLAKAIYQDNDFQEGNRKEAEIQKDLLCAGQNI